MRFWWVSGRAKERVWELKETGEELNAGGGGSGPDTLQGASPQGLRALGARGADSVDLSVLNLSQP